MKQILLLVAVALTGSLFAQNSEPYIEVAVEESIQLKMKTLDVNIFVRGDYSQMEEAMDREFYDYYYEDDYYYEYLLEEDPKSITKEMKKEYEERQEERKRQEAEMELFEANFKPYTVMDLMKDLDKNDIPYELVLDYSDGGSNDEYYDYEYYYDDYRTDSVVRVTVKNQDEFERLHSFTEDNYATTERNGDYERESIEGKYEEILPKLAAKAKERGTLIAKALGQELGALLSCSNIHPSLDYTSMASLEEMMDYEVDYYYYDNPFENSTDYSVGLVFRFKVK